MTVKEMEDIFAMEIPLEGLTVDSGIYEFHVKNHKSIGVSYEYIDDKPVYVFNIFLGNEYINICGEFKSIYDAVETVTNEWNKWQ